MTRLTAALLLASLGLASAAARSSPGGDAHPEDLLAEAVATMRDGNYGVATQRLESLLRIEPHFHLAQLLYGQVLALRSGPRIGTPLTDEGDTRMDELLAEYRQRQDSLRGLPAPGLVPDLLLQLSDEVRNALLVDLGKGRAYLVENGKDGPRVVRNLYAGIGRSGFGKRSEGDLRTPVGVYRINGWMADEQLPPLYGAGALPLNYPNSWDRALARTGSGIWLHGVPTQTYVRAPRSSEGCVTFANSDLLTLRNLVVIGSTPVILAEKLDWVPAEKIDGDRRQLQQAIEDWRRRESMLDTESYLALYADDFRSEGGLDKFAFARSKLLDNPDKNGVDIRLSDLSLFAYPGEERLVVAQFSQNYAGDGVGPSIRKDQYWRHQDDGSWKIVREMTR